MITVRHCTTNQTANSCHCLNEMLTTNKGTITSNPFVCNFHLLGCELSGKVSYSVYVYCVQR